MTGHDAAAQYIEKIALWNMLKPIGQTILNTVKSTPRMGSTLLGSFSGRRLSGVGMADAAKGAFKSNVLKDLSTEQLKTLGKVGKGAGYAGAGLLGLGVGNSIAGDMRQSQPTDVQVVYANRGSNGY